MRIVGGLYRSRKIKMVGVQTTRETTDMVRESVFNLMSNLRIEGIGLDLFSGSGAMGLEALSRGLNFCYFNDNGFDAYKTTIDNVKALELTDKATIWRYDYHKALALIDKKLNYIFLDPPYKLDCLNEIVKYIKENDMLDQEGVVVVEADKDYVLNLYGDYYDLYKERTYGIRKIIILKKKGLLRN